MSHLILAEAMSFSRLTITAEKKLPGLNWKLPVSSLTLQTCHQTANTFPFPTLGSVRNLSPQLWSLTHLTSLYLNDNCLTRVPPDICKLTSLQHLDLSSNKLRNLPAEIGDLIMLRELLLNNNILRSLPYELGKLFQLQNLGTKYYLILSHFFLTSFLL